MADRQLTFDGDEVPLADLVASARHARATDPVTSAKALEVPDRHERYVEILALAGRFLHGFTDDELAQRLPRQHPGSLSKRRLRLEKSGLLERTDVERITRFGSPAIVFVVTDKGRGVLHQWLDQAQS